MRLPDASPRSEAKKTAFPAILASTLVRRGAGYPRIAPKSPRQTAASYSSHPSCSSQLSRFSCPVPCRPHGIDSGERGERGRPSRPPLHSYRTQRREGATSATDSSLLPRRIGRTRKQSCPRRRPRPFLTLAASARHPSPPPAPGVSRQDTLFGPILPHKRSKICYTRAQV